MRGSRVIARFAACARAIALLLLLPNISHAGGFALNEWGARANAMGGAMIGLADDASAVAYNPAGITQLQGTQTMIGATAIAPKGEVTAGNQATTTTRTNIYLPPHVFLTHQLNDKVWLGMGMYTRFGVGTEYLQDWGGTTKVYKAEIASYSFTPNLAVKLTDDLSLALGLDVMYSAADLRQKVNLSPALDLRMTVDGIGVGGQAALHYKLNEQWSAGLVYRTSQLHRDTGKARYVYDNAAVSRRDDTLAISLTLPSSYSAGIAYKPTDKIKVEADAIYTQWGDYKKLTYSFSASPTTNAAGDVVKEKDWKNVWRLQLGGEYKYTDWLALRAGVVWDQDPIRDGFVDYMLPSNDRWIYSTGFGITHGDFTYDFSVMYLQNQNRNIDYNSNLISGGPSSFTNSRAYMAGFSLGYKF